MWHNNQHSDDCAICGKPLSGNALPFYHQGKHLPVHAVCRDKVNADLAKAIENAEDGPIVSNADKPAERIDSTDRIFAIVIAFFAGAAVATCAFLLWM